MDNQENKPFAAPAGHVHFDDETIEAAALKHVATDYHRIAHLIPNYRCTEQFARLKAFAEELASRCPVQGGITNDKGSDLAPTTSTVSAPEEVRNQALEDAAKACESEVVEGSGLREQEDHNYAVSQCAKLIRALKRTTSGKGEAE